MKKPWVNVAVFEDLNAARTLEAVFRQKAMEVRTYHDQGLQLFLFLRPPLVTWQVQVPGNFHHFALEVVDKNPPEILESAIHCPACGSLAVDYPHLTRPSFVPTVRLNLTIMFRAIDHQCYCEKCHHLWSLPRPSPAPDIGTIKPAH